MKKQRVIISATLGLLFCTQHALAAQTCAERQASLETERHYAEKQGPASRLQGVEKALAEVKQHCTADSVRQDAEQKVTKLQAKLADKKADLQQVEQDLQRAQAENNQKKIAKYSEKKSDKQHDIDKLDKELQHARQELKRVS